jgi:hypothetical protein
VSQIYKPGSGSGPIPPTVPTSFVTDVNSPAIPAANILNEIGGFTSVNNANGIQTDGSSGSNTLTIQITNRLQGTGTTVGATTADLYTFALGATPRTFIIEANIAAFNSTTPAGAGFSTYSTIITDGATATVIDDTDAISHRSPALIAADAEIIASGNNAILRVTGVAGLTINWSSVGTYVRAP